MVRDGGRRTGLTLARRDDGPLDEATVRSLWPEATRVRRLGEGLLLGQRAGGPAGGAHGGGTPRGEAERRAGEARLRGDRRGEAAALAGLAALLMDAGRAAEAGDLPGEAGR